MVIDPADVVVDPILAGPNASSENRAWYEEYERRVKPYAGAIPEERLAFPEVTALDMWKTMIFSTRKLAFQSGRIVEWCHAQRIDFFIERDPTEVGVGYFLRFRNVREALTFKMRWL